MGRTKLEALITLDEISDMAIDRLLKKQDSSIRDGERAIADMISKGQPPNAATELYIGQVLDMASRMSRSSFKSGMQAGAQLKLELLESI